jgi:hypothetical protein
MDVHANVRVESDVAPKGPLWVIIASFGQRFSGHQDGQQATFVNRGNTYGERCRHKSVGHVEMFSRIANASPGPDQNLKELTRGDCDCRFTRGQDTFFSQI